MDAHIDAWVDGHAIDLDPVTYEAREGSDDDAARLAAMDVRLERAPVVFLGETNHFVHQKAEFRLWWLRRLARHHRLIVGEELGWSDGRRIARYLHDGEEAHFGRIATFGYRGDDRRDRDDRPTGVLRRGFETYPTAAFAAEQIRFYRELREIGAVDRFFGFDVNAIVGGGYADVANARSEHGSGEVEWTLLERMPEESMQAEAERLARLLAMLPRDDLEPWRSMRADLEAMIGTLRYMALAHPAPDYESLRPAMAVREGLMKQRVAAELRRLEEGEVLVLMAHAFHLAKDDAGIDGQGVGPGGDRVPSLGHYLVQELGVEPFSAWMIYGGGEDSQPLPDLPRVASYSATSLNAQLVRHERPMVIPLQGLGVSEPLGIGHLYNQVTRVRLGTEADAVFFVPSVSPLRAD